jgi:hypothetical protein
MLVGDILKWRNTGAILICNVCAGTKAGRIVANDNYEILKIGPGHRVVIPERFKDPECCDNKEDGSTRASKNNKK